MARVVLTTFGSLGDLHPYLAIGLELRRRGHSVRIATHAGYRGRIEAAGLEAFAVRPDRDDFGDLETVMRAAMDERRGSEVVLRDLVLPWLRRTHADLLAACTGADLIVDHVLTYAAPVVAEQLRLPRVSTALQPVTLFSSTDPSLLPGMPDLRLPRVFESVAMRALIALARAGSGAWFRELDALRAECGLPRRQGHPLIDGASPHAHLVLFSPELAAPQPDWPHASRQTGFPIHDRDEHGGGMPPALASFLDRGEPPLVFTLGSSAVFTAGDFYTHAAAAARALGRRAVLLTGIEGRNPLATVPEAHAAGPDDAVVRVEYAPHSELMPRACAVVHQGGVGTTAQALRSGRPMLVVPFSHDQPDNARRCARRGVARVLSRGALGTASLTRELAALLADHAAARTAAEVGARVRAEEGAGGAAEVIESVLAGAR